MRSLRHRGAVLLGLAATVAALAACDSPTGPADLKAAPTVALKAAPTVAIKAAPTTALKAAPTDAAIGHAR